MVLCSAGLTAHASLLLELHHREKEVDVVVHHRIEAVEQVQLFWGVIPVLAAFGAHLKKTTLIQTGQLDIDCPSQSFGANAVK